MTAQRVTKRHACVTFDLVIVRIKISEQMTPEQREKVRRHVRALPLTGSSKRRNLIAVLNVLSTEDDTLDIDVEIDNS